VRIATIAATETVFIASERDRHHQHQSQSFRINPLSIRTLDFTILRIGIKTYCVEVTAAPSRHHTWCARSVSARRRAVPHAMVATGMGYPVTFEIIGAPM
jgi:hypothetical protein